MIMLRLNPIMRCYETFLLTNHGRRVSFIPLLHLMDDSRLPVSQQLEGPFMVATKHQHTLLYRCIIFLSAGENSEELEELRDEARELVKKIDLNWVRVWMR
jgi:hypothetical protein